MEPAVITTHTDPKLTAPDPTLDEMLAGVEAALSVLRPIGILQGEVVYLNQWDRALSFGGMTVSLDHPYLAGCVLWSEAPKSTKE